MLSASGQLWGVRLSLEGEDHWNQFPIGEVLGSGGAGDVHKIDAATRPLLVAKIYNNEIIQRVRTDPPFCQRLTVLAQNSAIISSELPFAMWPRRLLFTVRDPEGNDGIRNSLVGFTMQSLSATTSLYHLIRHEKSRVRVNPHHTAHIAATIADQLARLHRHPWGFVVGDFSPNNIHVTHDFSTVYFIDTDSFQFDYNSGAYAFQVPGLTPGYRAPGADHILKSTGRLTAVQDDYVLAIHIFMLLMADAGFTGTHPFTAGGKPEDERIAAREFPYADPVALEAPPAPLEAYNKFPADIRGAFVQTFTKAPPVTAGEWAKLLLRYRRGLQ